MLKKTKTIINTKIMMCFLLCIAFIATAVVVVIERACLYLGESKCMYSGHKKCINI